MASTSNDGDAHPFVHHADGSPRASQKIGPAKTLRDITSGNNDTEGLLRGQYPAGPGWDACSGWGTPDGVKLLQALQ